jgi:acetolactate synthase-1/3 small subunit
MRSYGEIDVARSGAIAMSLEAKKLRLQPPVPAGGAGFSLPKSEYLQGN